MSNLKLKPLLKKKNRLLTFLIICSILISENALAVYNTYCCSVKSHSSTKKQDFIKFYFKFFEYEPRFGVTNSYLESFVVEYSTDNCDNYKFLMSASTENQTTRKWAWIDFKVKKPLEKLYIKMPPSYQKGYPFQSFWEDRTKPRFATAVCDFSNTKTWCEIDWYREEVPLDVTHIKITAKWHCHISKITEKVSLVYDIHPIKPKLNSNNLNLSNSSHKQKTKNETVKVYKQANTIVIEGALDEKIQVYTTTGALVKSLVANRDVFQIPVPANYIYIVKAEQTRYKVAL